MDEASGYRIGASNNFSRHGWSWPAWKHKQYQRSIGWLRRVCRRLSTLVGAAVLALPGICLSNKRLSTGNLDNSCEWKLMIRSEGESRNSGVRGTSDTRLLSAWGLTRRSPCCSTLLKNRVAWVTIRSVAERKLGSQWFPAFASPLPCCEFSGDTISRDRHVQVHCVPPMVQLFPPIDRKFSVSTGLSTPDIHSRISYWLLYWTRHICELFRNPVKFMARLGSTI